MARVEAVENRSEEPLNIAENSEILINSFENILEEQIATKVPDIVKQVKNDLKITKLEGQMKSVLIELQHIRNHTMRGNLIFKGIDESVKEKWEDTPQVLADFIQGNLNLVYSYNEIDRQKNGKKNNGKGLKPIIPKLVNWCFAEEIHKKSLI